jgi:general stress protein 26
MTIAPRHLSKRKDLVFRLLNEHRVMAMATIRPDGWPQTTLVGYVNDGFLLYCFIARTSQKFSNIVANPRVSIAIGSDARHPFDIKGLSLAGIASEVTDFQEYECICKLRLQRFAEYEDLPAPILREGQTHRIASQPDSRNVVLLRIAPEVISVLDYSMGFGHTDLITFSERDLDRHIESKDDRWV